MRTKNSLRNTIVSVCGYGLVFILGLALRKIFILHLDIANLGYEGLFSNIFDLLATADLGVGALVTYRLYAAFADRDSSEIARLTALFRRLNWLITGAVFTLGLCMLPLLPLLIQDSVTNWNYVRLIYVLQMVNLSVTHPFDYCNTLLNADQKNHEVMRIWTAMRVFTQVVKGAAILLFRSYILYLLLAIFCNLMTGVITRLRCKKLYPDALRGRCTWDDFRGQGFIEELKGVGVSRILNAVYYATDSILISAMLGVRSVALYGNYTVISANVNAMFNSLLQPVAGSIGNFVNTESETDRFRLFETVDLICFFCASFALVSYGVLLQPVIGLLYGEEYLLSRGFVALFSLSHYLFIKCLGLNSFRGTFGNYREEWAWLGLAALGNIVLSILGCRLWGIAGIVFGTAVSLVLIWAGKSVLSFRHCFCRPGAGYMFRQALRLALAVGELGLVQMLTRNLPVSVGGIVLRTLACMALPNALNWIIYSKTPAFAQVRGYAQKALRILKERRQDSSEQAGS